MKLILPLGALVGSLLLSGRSYCADQGTIDRGRRLYFSNCIQCHNRDPNRMGSMGPEMIDAPLSVMTSKFMTGKYPEVLPAGFVPKRRTTAMKKIIKLEKDIPAIHAYVQSVKEAK